METEAKRVYKDCFSSFINSREEQDQPIFLTSLSVRYVGFIVLFSALVLGSDP